MAKKKTAAKKKSLLSKAKKAVMYGPIFDRDLAGKGKKRGRPKGSKNKTKFAEGAFSAIPSDHPSQKKRRGRPKGSKSKQYGPTREHFQPHLSIRKRGRGRPKGSKNKPKNVNMLLSKLGTKKAHVTLHGTITAG